MNAGTAHGSALQATQAGRWSAAVPLGLGASLVWVLAFAWFAFWLHGQRFFDDDYTRWLPAATSRPIGELARAVASPFPSDWGFLDRPVITLFFGVMHELFGREPTGYFLVKSAMGASVAVGVYVLSYVLLRPSLGAGCRGVAWRAGLAPALWVASPQVFLSMLWLCDLAVLAELCLLGAVSLHLFASEHDPWRGPQPRGQPAPQLARRRLAVWLAAQAAVLVVAYIGFKTKSSVKVLPVILLAHAAWVHGKGAWRYAPVAALLAAAAVPWASLAHTPLPEFAGGSGAARASGEPTPGYFWRAPDLTHAWRMLFELPSPGPDGGRVTPYSVLGAWFPWGWASVLTLAVGAVVAVARRRKEHIGRGADASATGVPRIGNPCLAVGIWLGLALATLLIYPEVPAGLRGRYLVGALAPMSVLLTWAWVSSSRGAAWMAGVLLVVHLFTCCSQTLDAKRSIGLTINLNDELRRRAEASDRDATFVYLLGQTDHGHWPSDRGNRYVTVPDGPAFEARKDLSETKGRVYLIVDRTGPLHPRAQWMFTVTAPQDAYHRIIGHPQGPPQLRAVYLWKASP